MISLNPYSQVLKFVNKMFQSNVTVMIILYLVAYFTVVNEFKRGIAAGSCHGGHGSVLARKLTNDS